MNRYLLFFFFALGIVVTGCSFIFSCVVTLSDAQGAFVFIFTIPIMVAALAISYVSGRKLAKLQHTFRSIYKIPVFISLAFILFFLCSFISVLRPLPDTVLKFVGVTFESVTGMSPYLYFKTKKSFTYLLSEKLKETDQSKISFSEMDVSFAWDRVCIFGPYTNKDKARLVLNLDFDIEKRSGIHVLDSVNALVFLFEGKVNQVVDLERSIVDFSEVDMCYDRNNATFKITLDGKGRRILSQKPK